jgi:hypothetical protein
MLPNGQTDIPQGNLINELDECLEPKTEVDTDYEEAKEFDGLAELRTVPVSEYHKLEGLKMLEIAKINGDSSDNDIVISQVIFFPIFL